MSLITRRYSTIRRIIGPLVFATGIKDAGMGEMCILKLSNGEERLGQILKLEGEVSIIQILEGTFGVDAESSVITLTAEAATVGVSMDMLGRVFNGVGLPIDGLPEVIAEKYLDINGSPINPAFREKPDYFIETGVSAIDGLNTLVRGQKLPIFSMAGLPANELAIHVVTQSRISKEEDFCVVFGAIGVSSREAFFFKETLSASMAAQRTVAFFNLARDPAIERLFTPRMALTVAEYLAFDKGYHVMVVLTDMTAYCEALREIAGAREEIPGRRSYPGYMYTDLATIYERAGRVKGRKGSITIMPILTMPEDDITHPVPDLSGYITEGQLVLSRSLHNKGFYPPIDILPSLSRLMNLGIGEDKTRHDHRKIADQLYASYAKGCDIRRIVSIVGMEGLGELDKKYLFFADEFEKRFISQGNAKRTIYETLELGLSLLRALPETELTRLK